MKRTDIKLLGDCIQFAGVLLLVFSLLPYINPMLFRKTQRVDSWPPSLIVTGVALSIALMGIGWAVQRNKSWGDNE